MIFRVTMIGHYWDRVPQYQIIVDGDVQLEGEIKQPSGQPDSFDFDIPDLPDGPHKISIRLNNKTDDQTVKDQYEDPDNYTIVKDMTLEVVSIEIDTIDLGSLIWNGLYHPDHPVEYKGESNVSEIPFCLNMGWNGSFDLEFGTPLYLWLLESL